MKTHLIALKISSSSILALSLLLASCGKKPLVNEQSAGDAEIEASIEAGMSVVSGMYDSENNQNTYAFSTQKPSSIWQTLLLNQAVADACIPARFASCINGVRSSVFSDCSVRDSKASILGRIDLVYSDSNCAMEIGNSVSRTYDVQISGPRGGVVFHDSLVKADYLSQSYGGGGKITKTADGWDLDVLGRHTRFEFRGQELRDLSVRTLETIRSSGTLSRVNRIVHSGKLEINHNRAQFTSTLVPNEIKWEIENCCHPTAGTLSIELTGSKTGKSTIEFQGCGSAKVTNAEGQVSDLTLSYCE